MTTVISGDTGITFPNGTTQGSAANLPPGVVLHFANSAVPFGWLACNGAAVSRTTYAELFAAIGTVYGSGDGSTTFNVPDLRGQFLRGWDAGAGVDPGRAIGSSQADAFLTHKHYQGAGEEYPTLGSFANTTWRNGSTPDNLGKLAWTSTAYTTGNAATGDSETRPKNIAMLPCIKT